MIPTEIKSLLKSGKLSTKAMPAGRFNELHEDCVCSCALRVGRELLAILPDDLVIITALDNVLNSSTGHLEEQPILSARALGQLLTDLTSKPSTRLMR